jgi:uncharacterized protein YllA (UPF0747 family)
MERYRLRPKDFFHGQEPLREQIASRLVPEGLERQFDDVTSATEQNLDKLQRAIAAYDPTLGDAVQKSRAKMLHQLSKMRGKVARETLRRSKRSLDEADYLYHTVYPEKHLQERFYSILPFLARHGVELIDHLYDSVKLDCPDHILLQV